MEVNPKLKKAYGITPAARTIWNADETYNKKGMEKYLDWLLDNGAQSLSIVGSTGENMAMNEETQKEVLGHVASYINGAVPLVGGTGKYDTCTTLELSHYAEDCGYDALLVLLPFYYTPHKKSVLQHYRNLRKELNVNMFIYNNPWFAGYELNTQEVKSLIDDGTIQGIKAAHGDPNRVHDLKYYMGDKITVFYGHDYCGMEAYCAGADGWLSGIPAILPKQCRAIQDAVQAGDLQAARKAQDNIIPFLNYFLYDKENGVPHWLEICNYTLTAQGVDVGLPRRPAGDLDDANKKKIEKLLADMD